MSEKIEHLQRMGLAGTLAGGIAHDLNNQLTLVLGNIERAMNRISDTESAYDSLAHAKKAASRCADMSRRLVSLGRRSRPAMVRVDIAAALIEAEETLECIRSPNIRLATDAEPGLYILGDETALQQVLINLATNALHAMPHGGDLIIQAYLRDHKVHICVQDTGCGITPTVLQYIFEPFYTTRPHGTGLGLSTARSIVENFGGLMDVHSVPNRGTVFFISFPALPPEDAEIETVSPEELTEEELLQ